jgi:HD-like signal output (HDOD) protein
LSIDALGVDSTERDSPFAFLQELARELSQGRVELPSFPDVVARVQNAVADPYSTSERLAKVVGADGALASRLFTMANSALLHSGGARITDLKLAITRIGYEHVRTAALAYAAGQLLRAPALVHIRADLERYWQESTQVAALAYAIAREKRSVRADEAMLAGLVHNIGKVYILSRAPRNSELNADPELRDQLLAEWHPSIGQAIVENWKLSDEIATAVGGQLDRHRTHKGPPDLQDFLVVALAMADEIATNDGEGTEVSALPVAQHLGLDDAAIIRIVLDLKTDLLMLQAALG